MFVHMVLFKIRKSDVPTYRADCRMWSRQARCHRGYLDSRTLRRTNEKGQYASFYVWKTKKDHSRFMKRHHDRLVSLSKCPVKVLGYYDFETLA